MRYAVLGFHAAWLPTAGDVWFAEPPTAPKVERHSSL
jgi:hypothetical protein